MMLWSMPMSWNTKMASLQVISSGTSFALLHCNTVLLLSLKHVLIVVSIVIIIATAVSRATMFGSDACLDLNTAIIRCCIIKEIA